MRTDEREIFVEPDTGEDQQNGSEEPLGGATDQENKKRETERSGEQPIAQHVEVQDGAVVRLCGQIGAADFDNQLRHKGNLHG